MSLPSLVEVLVATSVSDVDIGEMSGVSPMATSECCSFSPFSDMASRVWKIMTR
jgi:hypothetical protein